MNENMKFVISDCCVPAIVVYLPLLCAFSSRIASLEKKDSPAPQLQAECEVAGSQAWTQVRRLRVLNLERSVGLWS